MGRLGGLRVAVDPGRDGARATRRDPTAGHRLAARPCGRPHRRRRPRLDERRCPADGDVGRRRVDADVDGRGDDVCASSDSRPFAVCALPPRDAAPAPAPAHTVRPGEGLWQIAEDATRRRRRLDAGRRPQPRPRHGRRPAVRRPRPPRGWLAPAPARRGASSRRGPPPAEPVVARRRPRPPARVASPSGSAPWPAPPWPVARGDAVVRSPSPVTSTCPSGARPPPRRRSTPTRCSSGSTASRRSMPSRPPTVYSATRPGAPRSAAPRPHHLRLAVGRDVHPVGRVRAHRRTGRVRRARRGWRLARRPHHARRHRALVPLRADRRADRRRRRRHVARGARAGRRAPRPR